ncbi:MAG: sugar ABC transporter permease [Candidatus Sumerlaeia bacterium]|nr:sugar ABC transporter permease [Candidatus Sumerlaeia bacterium]
MSTAASTVPVKPRPIPLGRRLRETGIAYAYLAPATLILLAFWLWPAIFALFISFADYRAGGTMDFTEWWKGRNYSAVLTDAEFLRSLVNTVNFVVYSVPPSLALSLAVAVMLNQRIKFLGFFRTVYFLPYITSIVAVSVVWLYVFNYHSGLANWLLQSVGMGKINWLADSRGIWEILAGTLIGDEHFRIGQNVDAGESPVLYTVTRLLRGPSVAMMAIIIMTVWRSIGYSMVIFLAGLQGIDRSYYEAAEIDGATPWQKFWHITWPLISPYTFFLAVISTIFAFKEFVPVYIMTPQGGSDYDTATVVFYLYDLAFQGRFDFDKAAAVGFVLFAILTVISLIQKRVFGRKVHYE